MCSINVVVRVRPRIDDASSHTGSAPGLTCVQVDHDNVVLTRASAPERGNIKPGCSRLTEVYSFDRCYTAENDLGDSQENLYKDVGVQLVDAALDGFNACVFAYGQTSSGKTYTMLGPSHDPGLIPRIFTNLHSKCNELKLSSVGQQSFAVQVGYLEIYNEKIRDLLADWHSSRIEPPSLKIREHPQEGVFVQGLSMHNVKSYSDVAALLAQGNKVRAVAATNMNEYSSRSHAIVVAQISRATFLPLGVPEELISKLHLVDLAGSERTKNTGTTNQRLKEGCSINQSLASLGKTISLLVEYSKLDSRKRQHFHIPYRNSSLTFLLKDSLGGNAKTFMIATISPLVKNFSETRNTLLYASRARKIVNKPVINQDPNAKVIHNLRAEISHLKHLLSEMSSSSNRMLTSVEPTSTDSHTCSCNHGAIIESRIETTELRMQQLTSEWGAKWLEISPLIVETESSPVKTLEFGLPFISLVDRDQGKSSTTMMYLKEGETKIGTNADLVDFVVEDDDLGEVHCAFFVEEDTVTLISHGNSSVKVDNERVISHRDVHHGNVITLSSKTALNFSFPAELMNRSAGLGRTSSQQSLLSPRSCSSCNSSRGNSRPGSIYMDHCSSVSPTFSVAEFSNASSGIQKDIDVTESAIQTDDNIPCCSAESELNDLQRAVLESCDLGLTHMFDTRDAVDDEINSQMMLMMEDSEQFAIIEDKLYCEIEDEVAKLGSLKQELLREKECILNLVNLENFELAKLETRLKGSFEKCSPVDDIFSDDFNTTCKEDEPTCSKETSDVSELSQSVPLTNREELLKQVQYTMHKMLNSTERESRDKYSLQLSIEKNMNRVAEIDRKVAAIAEKKQWLSGYFDKLKKFFRSERHTMRTFQRQMEKFHVNTTEQLEMREQQMFKSRLALERRFIRSCPASPVSSFIVPSYLCKSAEDIDVIRKPSYQYRHTRRFMKRKIIPPANTYSLVDDSGGVTRHLHGSKPSMVASNRSDSCSSGSRSRSDSVFSSHSLPTWLPSSTPAAHLDPNTVATSVISIRVPRFRRRKSQYNYYHEFQIEVSFREETWTVFHRFSALRDMHVQMKTRYPELKYLDFPPRRAFGSRMERVAADRRVQLERYLQSFVNLASRIPQSPFQNSFDVNRDALVHFLPFLNPNYCMTGDSVSQGGDS